MDEIAEDQKSESVSFVEMKAMVGSIIFLWSSIERELAKRIETPENGTNKNGAHTVAQKIARWKSLQAAVGAKRPEHQSLLQEVRERLNRALDIRNRVENGLIGIIANPFGHHGDAHLETELNGETRRHTHP